MKKILGISLLGLTSIFSISIPLVLTSCGHNNPYSSLTTGGAFSIKNNTDKNDLLTTAKQHIELWSGSNIPSDQDMWNFLISSSSAEIETASKAKASTQIYWEIAYHLANTYEKDTVSFQFGDDTNPWNSNNVVLDNTNYTITIPSLTYNGNTYTDSSALSFGYKMNGSKYQVNSSNETALASFDSFAFYKFNY